MGFREECINFKTLKLKIDNLVDGNLKGNTGQKWVNSTQIHTHTHRLKEIFGCRLYNRIKSLGDKV